MIVKMNGNEISSSNDNIFVDMKDTYDFIKVWKEDGLWQAIYDKPFSQVMGEFFKELGHDILVLVLGNSDLFFLLPAIVFFIGTWLVGRNKFTKWILPLTMAYCVSHVFYYLVK